MKALAEIKNDVGSIGVLSDWLGIGLKPVSQEHAEARASICVSCPMNSKDHWWHTLKTEVALEIRKQAGLKNKLKLNTSHDQAIGECRVCSCVLLLLCWVPTNILKEREPPERLTEYPEHCWKRKELEAT